MKKLTNLLLAFVLGMSAACADTAKEYDLVIKNGRVMDPETQFDTVANVGVSDGRIVIITKDDISGKEDIDAKGLVVAPGFIDGHQHNLELYAKRLMVRDGRTTVLDLEVGAPGEKIDDFYKRHEGNSPINFGVAVAHEFARASVLDGFTEWKTFTTNDAIFTRKNNGWTKTRPTLEQGNEILKIIDEGLRNGGIGVGSTVGYMRDGVSTREVYEINKLAAAYGRQMGMHVRGTPGTDVEEVNGNQEMMANAAALGGPGIALHFNNPGYNLVHELMVEMRSRGHNVWGEVYPYEAGSTAINAVFLAPETWVEKLGNKYEETIFDPSTNKFLTAEDRERLLKTDPTHIVVVYKMPKEAVIDWIRMPGVAIGSDGMPLFPDDNLKWETPYEEFPATHPRFSGSFAKVFRLARENNIPLMQAVSMSSYNYAKPLGDMGLKAMQERGRMQEGMIADITIFDADKITDNATFENGTIPSSGILHVVVNGIIVMKDEEPIKRLDAGQAIRFEPQKKGHFKPISKESWVKEFYSAPIDNFHEAHIH